MTTEPITAPNTQSTNPRQRTTSFEVFSWYFMRISGLFLLFLALGHFALTHIVTDVAKTNAQYVNRRWRNPLWRIYDWLLLVLGLFHGVNGLRYIMDDYIRNATKRAITKTLVYTITGSLMLYGTLTIVMYHST